MLGCCMTSDACSLRCSFLSRRRNTTVLDYCNCSWSGNNFVSLCMCCVFVACCRHARGNHYVQPNGSLCATNHCITRYEHIFRHHKHTHTNQKAVTDQHSRHNHEVHRKLHQAYTTYRNHTSIHLFKTDVPQGGVLSPTLFNIYT